MRPRLSALEQFQTVAGYKNSTVGKEFPVVFGSIGVLGASQSPSPAPLPSRKADQEDGTGARGEEEDEKAFTMFSIGVAPGHDLSRLRAKAVSKTQTRTAMASAPESEAKTEGNTHTSAESKIIDLTDSQELKWEFGTATSSFREDGSVHSPLVCSENLHADTEASKNPFQETLPPVLPSITGFEVHHGKSTSGSPPGEVQTGAPQVESISSSMEGTTEGALLYSGSRKVGSGDDFEVKDFGYGFGPASGTGRAPVITREERDERERERRREREKIEKEKEKARMGLESQELAVPNGHNYEREMEKEKIKDIDVPVRSRPGSYNGGAAYDRSERTVRRGRGLGRAYHGRRGGFQQNIAQQQQQRHPFTVTPPQALFQPLKTTGETPNGYYPQPRVPYISPGYDPYLSPTAGPTTAHTPAPVPVPVTTISFPLDPTRWYLLGQLEYYLSPQNMVQDFFLRQQVRILYCSCSTDSSEYAISS
jgi:la-related protein 1